MLDYIIEKDKEWLCYLNQMGSTEADAVWLVITNELASIPLYAFLLYLCCKYFHWKKVLLILVCIALVVATTDQLANIFKHGFQRLRPCHDETLIDRMYITPFLLCWSLVVSYSRIYLGVHFPGDVLVGLTIGALLSLLYYRLFLWLEKKML